MESGTLCGRMQENPIKGVLSRDVVWVLKTVFASHSLVPFTMWRRTGTYFLWAVRSDGRGDLLYVL